MTDRVPERPRTPGATLRATVITPPTVRRGTPDDTRACLEVFAAAITDLAARQNIPWDPSPDELWDGLGELYAHLAEHAAEWWVAEGPDGLVGYARSVERGGLFELSEFFVRPDSQSAGLGAALLGRAFPDDRGEVRAIIATTDMRAQARYYRAGTVARFPMAGLEGTPGAAGPPPPPDLEIRPASEEDLATLVRIEREVLEFDRGDEFAWLLAKREGYLYLRDGIAVGFGFIARRGAGPIAALHADDQVPILLHLEARAVALGRETLTLDVPMPNEVAMRHLLARGFRLDPFLTLLMASRPFGQFDRYIGYSPPFIL